MPQIFLPPTLESDRLILRPLRLEDFEPYAALMASDRGRYMFGVLDREEAWNFFCQDVAHWNLFGFGSLTLTLKTSGEAIGNVGIGKGVSFPEPELGWQLFDGHEGHGYATEAAATLRHFAYSELGLTTLVSYIDPENAGSLAVARRLGAKHDPSAPQPPGDPCLVHRHPAASVLLQEGAA